MKKRRGIVLSILAALSVAHLALAADLTVVPVTEKLFLFKGLAGGNVAFLVTEKGVLVVDSGTSPGEGKAIVEKIHTATGKPIRYLVLTHYHGDHTYGLQSYPENVIMIGQQNIVGNTKLSAYRLKEAVEKLFPERIAATQKNIENLKKKKSKDLGKEQDKLKQIEEEYAAVKEIRLVYPEITYDKKLTVSLGGETVEVIYPGNAHTSCNSLVYFPGQKAIHMGDILFNGMIPYIGAEAGSDTLNWIARVKEVAGWPVGKVIPGHGDVTGRQGLLNQASYLSDLRAAVQKAILAGETLEKMKKSITLPAWKDLQRQEGFAQNIEAVYNELKK